MRIDLWFFCVRLWELFLIENLTEPGNGLCLKRFEFCFVPMLLEVPKLVRMVTDNCASFADGDDCGMQFVAIFDLLGREYSVVVVL